MSFFAPQFKLQQGVNPVRYARNGVHPSGPQVGMYAVDLLNHQLAHRMRRHFSKTVDPSELVNNGGGAGPIVTWRCMFRTLPNEAVTKARFTFGPSDTGTPEPTAKVWLRITEDASTTIIYDDGTSGTDGSITYTRAIATPTSAVPNDLILGKAEYSLTPDTLYRCELMTEASASVQSLSVFGKVVSSLDPDTHVCVDPVKLAINQPISSTVNADVLGSLHTLWKRHGSAMAYSVPGTTAKTVASATSTNILDSTTTWTSSTKGFLYPALNKHSLETTLGSATYAVPVQAWVYGSCSGGGTGTVRFRWGTGASDYVEVTGITTAGWYKATGTIPGNADQKIDIYAAASAGTVSVYAAGMFDYSA